MSIPHVYAPVKPQDFTLVPVRVHKKFLIQRSQLYSGSLPQTSSGYRILDARFTGEKLKLETDSQTLYPTNSFDGSYKNIIWNSIDAQYYRFPYDPFRTLEHSNRRYTYKFLNYSASLISIPYMDYGECIKPGSVELTSSGLYLTDDRNGNIYDTVLNTGSYSDRYNLVAYWGFNNEFRRTKNIDHDTTFEKTIINFESGIFEPDEGSIAKNIHIIPGVLLNGTASGCCAHIHDSYILTRDRPEFNFTKDDDFTISLWCQFEPHGIDPVATLISKDTIITKQVYGQLDKPNANELVQPTFHVSSSTTYEPTSIYPYRLEVASISGVPQFKRSDGTKTISLSGSSDIGDDRWHHIAAVKSGSMLYFYQDGTLTQSGSDVNDHPINHHSLIFGADKMDQSEANILNGALDEIRIYNKGLSSATIATLADSSSMGMYQTSVVGNVFYKSGNVVLTSPVQKYNDLLNVDWTLRFRSTHVIYSYECLVRIPAGSFNLSQNPTSLKNPLTDLIIDDMTGSLADGALFPYCTAIGLYNEKLELVAIAKLSQPLGMRDDCDLNIVVRWDS